MKTTNKVFLLGMISVLLTFGFVLASCSQVFEGKEGLLGSGKTITLTLKSSSYEIKYDGKTYKGDAEKASASGIDTYVWKSGGTGGVIVQDKKATFFSYTDGTVSIVSINSLKRSLESGEIYLDDIELIIIED